ncbi:MAG TPA: M20/M25/M40 family metallo-hydrolase [Verrucomicrobiae bacterium]|jgi:Zn-dependent M28 family amino/carboxypeptidase|nr:M20/M25/M40 family metallo-hydrolase [Verrucomicrobiae bacterium]
METASLALPDKSLLKRHLERVAVPRDVFQNPDGLAAVRDYVESELAQLGYRVTRDPFDLNGAPAQNLIARKAASREGAYFMIGAHFDAVPGTPGADDNASGVAAMLEAARILAPHKASDKIDFVAFDGEEYGMAGSEHLSRALKVQGAALGGMISLEMVGYTSSAPGSQKIPAILKPFYPDTGNFLALVGDLGSIPLLAKAKTAFRATPLGKSGARALVLPAKGWVFPACRLSDHSPFWDRGYPALLVTDTSFFRNPHYHLPADNIATLDLDFMASAAEGAARLALAVVDSF